MANITILHSGPAGIKRIFGNAPSPLHRIFLVSNGAGELHIDDELFLINGHSCIFIYPEQRIEAKGFSASEMYCIGFDESFFYVQSEHKELLFRTPFFSYALASPVARISIKQFAGFEVVGKLMLVEFKHAEEWCDQILLSLLNVFLLRVKRFKWAQNQLVHKNDYTTLQLVVKFKQLIRSHCHKHHSVSWYADQLQQTSNYLNLMVKRVTGKTAGDLIAAQLIMEAKRQLMHTKLSPKEVAFALGFYDHSYFSKFFKKQTGFTPLDWFNKHK